MIHSTKAIKGILLLFLYFLSAYTFAQSKSNCSVCFCRGTVANCTNRSLRVVPELPPSITTLLFSGNYLYNITDTTFINIKSLNITSLYLDYCNISRISKDAFQNFKWLVKLDMSGNRALKIPNLLEALKGTLVKNLSLNRVGLTETPNGAYPFSSLKRLDLRDNELQRVDNKLLSKMFPNLQHLDLYNNRIGMFSFTSSLPNISFLNIGNNRLESGQIHFCVKGSETSHHLVNLDISWNFLTEIQFFRLQGHCLPRLKILILNNNYHMFTLPDNVFSQLPKIETIHLKYISKNLDIKELAFNVSTLLELRLTTSEQLFLESSKKTINMLKLCPNLITLHFTNVIFRDIQDNLTEMFSHLKHLKDFKIKYGIIWDIQFLSNMTSITQLDLFGNYISQLDGKVFENLPLTSIFLGRNQLSLINENSFSNYTWTHMENFSASSNPFECTCNLYWFRGWIKKNRKKIVNYPELYQCEAPQKWKGTFLFQFDPGKEQCVPPVSAETVAGIGLGCLVGVLLLLGAIVYKGRYHIKHRMYLARSLQPYERIPDGDEFVYDAFVAHHVTNRLWVINHLLPFLEKQKKLRLCLHERDFLPGNFIVDNIVTNMKVSRKIILVLSDQFNRSEWCLFEASTAYNRMIQEGTSSVVLIMLEDISSRDVSDTIKNLLHTVSYLEWKDAHGDRPYFWKKLVDALH